MDRRILKVFDKPGRKHPQCIPIYRNSAGDFLSHIVRITHAGKATLAHVEVQLLKVSTPTHQSGDSMRKQIQTIFASVVFGTVVAIGSVAAANATTVYPEGGTHQYGVYTGSAEETHNYSNYHHPTNWHRSSVKVTNGTVYRSADRPKGAWAKIDKETGWHNNQAFYYKYSY